MMHSEFITLVKQDIPYSIYKNHIEPLYMNAEDENKESFCNRIISDNTLLNILVTSFNQSEKNNVILEAENTKLAENNKYLHDKCDSLESENRKAWNDYDYQVKTNEENKKWFSDCIERMNPNKIEYKEPK